MVLAAAQIRPGRVLKVEDEKGTIKAMCCGLFSEEDDPENLPPVYPFPLGCANTFSSPKEDDEIWVMFFSDNPMELFYIRKDNFPENLQDTLSQDYEDCEVLASRELASGMVQIYFTNGDGWIIRNVDSVIQMRKDGSILLDTGSDNRKIDICNNSISLGSEGGSEHTAGYGDEITTQFRNIGIILKGIADAAKATPFTAGIKMAIDSLMQSTNYDEQCDKIESPHVTLD